MTAKPQALVFDINETLLDMTAIKQGLAPLLNDDDSLVDLWFATLLHHSLVDIASGQFHDFIDIGAAALEMVAHTKGLVVTQPQAKEAIKQHITALPAHNDVTPALRELKSQGFTLVALSNSSIQGLKAQLQYAELTPLFDHVLSTETINTYKPHSAVYHWACQQIGVAPNDAMMVAAHGWDVSGAKATGMQTAFIQRPGKLMYPLGLPPTLSVDSLTTLVQQLSTRF